MLLYPKFSASFVSKVVIFSIACSFCLSGPFFLALQHITKYRKISWIERMISHIRHVKCMHMRTSTSVVFTCSPLSVTRSADIGVDIYNVKYHLHHDRLCEMGSWMLWRSAGLHHSLADLQRKWKSLHLWIARDRGWGNGASDWWPNILLTHTQILHIRHCYSFPSILRWLNDRLSLPGGKKEDTVSRTW